MKKVLSIVLGVLLAISLPMLILVFYGMSDIKGLAIGDVDLSRLADGTYTGSYHKGRWTYDVEVAVQDHRIVSVKNKNPRMEGLAEFNRDFEREMLKQQRVNIDVISGATVNSKAFEKAVELALSSPPWPGTDPAFGRGR